MALKEVKHTVVARPRELWISRSTPTPAIRSRIEWSPRWPGNVRLGVEAAVIVFDPQNKLRSWPLEREFNGVRASHQRSGCPLYPTLP
jgi:hypothetical protein